MVYYMFVLGYSKLEEHGQWDDDLQRFHYRVKSINAEEQLTYHHARNMYETAKGNLARKGFVPSFTPNGPRKEPHSDQRPESELATA
jgi:hypothetical protein